MIVAIHQPNYLPWIGYFHKIATSDHFVLLDDVQYTKNSFINRNRIKSPSGPAWLTIPVQTAGQWGAAIRELSLDPDARWIGKHRKSLQACYARSPYYREVIDEVIDPVYCAVGTRWTNMASFNGAMIQSICRYLAIDTPVSRAGDCCLSSHSTNRLIELVRAVGGTAYLSGRGGDNYQDAAAFAEAGIELTYTDFVHPRYEQLWGPFESNLSVIDWLFNCGRAAAERIHAAPVASEV